MSPLTNLSSHVPEELEFESGSYRDRSSRVVVRNGAIYRVLDAEAVRMWEALQKSRFFSQATERGDLVETTVPTNFSLAGVDPQQELSSEQEWAGGQKWEGVLQHERIPFVSYPYEWTFGMLRDAGLLHLRLLREALQDDLITKDGSAYNIQWHGTRPVFIDIGSFERYKPGHVWAGYRQFCQTILFPLMLQAHRGVPFQYWMRGSLEGIDLNAIRPLFKWREFWKPGVLVDVLLHAQLQGSQKGVPAQAEMKQAQTAGFNKEMVRNNLTRLEKILTRLTPRGADSHWVSYAGDNSYADADATLKQNFIERIAGQRHRQMVWDCGCNTGRFSRIMAKHSDQVIAFDADLPTLESLYAALQSEGRSNILPLYLNIADPSPEQGWRGCERRTVSERGKPDLVLALALIHHLVIGANLPMREVIDWFASLRANLVIEFVSRQDPMVKSLLRNKTDNYWDYDEELFRRLLETHFTIQETAPLNSGTRTLYYAEYRATP
ncbi:MAG: class I SAM-dependent methyltransferase [Planctomycetales bacterium]